MCFIDILIPFSIYVNLATCYLSEYFVRKLKLFKHDNIF